MRYKPHDTKSRLLPFHTLDSRYEILEQLGEGSFGDVALGAPYASTVAKFPAMQSAGVVAIKTLRDEAATQAHVEGWARLHEVEFLSKVPASPYLISVHEVFVDRASWQCQIVMEVMQQDLWDLTQHRVQNRLPPFPRRTVRSMVWQIASGIAHIHAHGYLHRDIKPENVLVTQDGDGEDGGGGGGDTYRVKLADFGITRHCTCTEPFTTYVSTRWYRAPELLLKCDSYSFAVDVWALGVVTAEIANLVPLFPGDSEVGQLAELLRVLGTPRKQAYGGSWAGYYQRLDDLQLATPQQYVPGVEDELQVVVGGNDDDNDNDDKDRCVAAFVHQCLQWDPLKRPSCYQLLLHAPLFQPQQHQQEQRRQASSKKTLTTAPARSTNMYNHTEGSLTDTDAIDKFSLAIDRLKNV